MKHAIVYKQGGREIGREERDCRRGEVQAYVDEAVGSGGNEEIEVYDEEGRLVYHRPRTVSKSPSA